MNYSDTPDYDNAMVIYTEPTKTFEVVDKKTGRRHFYELSESVVEEMLENDLCPQAWAERYHAEQRIMYTAPGKMAGIPNPYDKE